MADVVIVDLSTGQTTTRPMTAEEESQRQADAAAGEQRLAREESQRGVDSTLRDRLVTGYDAMKAHVDRGTFTATQRDAALLLCLRGVMALIRITLRRLDQAD